MDRKIRFATIGCGRIFENHSDAIKHAPHAELVAVCDVVEEKAKKAAEENGLSKWYTDIDTMLENEEIDVCCILTPSGMHLDCARIVAKHKVNVLCEKPLEVTKERMDKLIDCCKENDVKLGCIFQRRTYDAAIKTKEAIEKGHLGKITMADASLKYYRDQEYYDSGDWRATWKYDGGGALMNQGVHGVDMIAWMMGGVYSVDAICETKVWDIEVEDTAIVKVRFNNGAIGVIEGSTCVNPANNARFEIHCENGTISFDDEGVLQWVLNGENVQINGPDGAISSKDDPTKLAVDSHSPMVNDLVDSILNDTEPTIGPKEARKAVDTILAIYQSSRENREVIL